jgi:hypothetical protein
MTDTLVLLMTGAEAEGSDIPKAVPIENVAPETQVSVFKPVDLHGRYPQQGRRWGSP